MRLGEGKYSIIVNSEILLSVLEGDQNTISLTRPPGSDYQSGDFLISILLPDNIFSYPPVSGINCKKYGETGGNLRARHGYKVFPSFLHKIIASHFLK